MQVLKVLLLDSLLEAGIVLKGVSQAQQEIDEVLGEKDQPDVKGYSQLRYLTRCVNESMRLYPHPPVLLRRAEVEDTLPGSLCLKA